MRDGQLILLAAGGTGGHLFPAEALAAALGKRGAKVALATDTRAAHFGGEFGRVHVIPSATLRGRDPLAYATTGVIIAAGIARAWALLGRMKPAVAVGFGGYPTIPPLWAASLRGIPTVLHDQNAVMGRANRLLAPRVTAIASSFAEVAKIAPELQSKVTFTGNPVRPAVIAAAVAPYVPPRPGGPLRLIVFGGSQGAKVMSDIVPAAIAQLSHDMRARMIVVQQARNEDVARVRDAYAKSAVNAEIAAFFSDLPARIAASHLVIARSGASTVAELSAIGRPAVLVPLPHSLDQDQFFNAGFLHGVGAAARIEQKDFVPERVASELSLLFGDPGRLAGMAAAAKAAGTRDAAERLAELVMKTARQPA